MSALTRIAAVLSRLEFARGARLAMALFVLALVAIPAAAVGDSLPTVSVETASEIGVTTVKLSGQVNPHGSAGSGNTTWKFQYSPIGEETWATAGEGTIEAPASEEGNPVAVETVFGNGGALEPGHEYEFRLIAENGAGRAETAAPYPTFTMDEAVPPVLTIGPVTNIGVHSAHFTGTIDPEGGNTNPIGPEVMLIRWHFEYSTDGTHWIEGPGGDISGAEAQGTSPITVEADATNLIAQQSYQVRLHAISTNFSAFNLDVNSPEPNPSFETGTAAPTITEQPVGGFDPVGGSVTLAGFVNPENSSITDCHFVYGIGSPSGNESPCSPKPVATSEQQRVGITAETGQFKLTYEGQTTENIRANVRPEVLQAALEALSTIGPGNVSVTEAETEGRETAAYIVAFVGALSGKDLPQLEWSQGSEPLHSVKAEEAKKKFEEETGTETDLVLASVETVQSGNIQEAVRVTATIGGLALDSEYRYKIVATNGNGTSEGPVNWFKTAPKPAPEGACPNEARRLEQGSSAAECRAYELTSPTDKGNINISTRGIGAVAATDGSAAAFKSHGEFADSAGSAWNGFVQYLTRRGPAGWTTHGISPTPSREVPTSPIASTFNFQFSDDLRKTLLWAYDLPEVSGDIPSATNLYRQDIESGALEVLTPASQLIGRPFPFEWINKEWGGSSSDLGVTAFNSLFDRFDSRAYEFTSNAYEWDHGTVRLAGVLPDGNVPEGGSRTPEEGASGFAYLHSVSSDGSRMVFYSPADGNHRQLYMRRNHSETVLISEPEFSGAPEPENVRFLWASPDLHKILFRADSPLVDEGPGTNQGGIFLYTDGPSPASEPKNLKLISKGLNSSPYYVAGATDDARRIYFTSGFENSLFLWENNQVRDLGIHAAREGTENGAQSFENPGNTRTSMDGSVFALITETDNHPGIGRLNVFNADRNTEACVSCGSTIRGSKRAAVIPLGDAAAVGIGEPRNQPRYLSSDGRRLFFSTPEAFVPEDTNGVEDVYVYDTQTGKRELISSGKGEHNAWFATASTSGSDVFILTANQLVGADPDHLVDLYDARVNGGFPEPPPPPSSCSGDNCRGPLSSPLEGRSPATSSFSGPGNPHPKPHRKKHRRKHRGKKGHRHHHRHSHRAGAHR